MLGQQGRLEAISVEESGGPILLRCSSCVQLRLAVSALICAAASGCMGPLESGALFGQSQNKTTARTISSAPASQAAATAPAGATLKVQNETLSTTDVWRDHKSELQQQVKALPPDQFNAFVQSKAVQLITDRVSESLMYQQAVLRLEKRIVDAIEAQVDSDIRKLVTAKYGGVQRRYERELEQSGESLNRVRELRRRELMVTAYLEMEVKPKVAEPTRAELMTLYQENVESWRKPSRRSMSLIEVRIGEFLPKGTGEPTREQWEAARREAQARARTAKIMIDEGAEFGTVAQSYSHGLQAPDGGKWGWITAEGVRERFLPAVKALETLQAGQVSAMIETPESFFLVRCDELEPGFEPNFENVQPELADRFFRIHFNQRIAVHVEDLRQRANLATDELERFHRAVVEAGYREAQPTP